MDEVGRNARHVSKLIDGLREKGRLHEKVPLENGGTLRIELNHRSFHQLQEIFIEKRMITAFWRWQKFKP